jgi:hypothetical protein
MDSQPGKYLPSWLFLAFFEQKNERKDKTFLC